jgi:hypothetical protein
VLDVRDRRVRRLHAVPLPAAEPPIPEGCCPVFLVSCESLRKKTNFFEPDPCVFVTY